MKPPNRGKMSVTIDLIKEKGREVVYRLVEKADVFVTSLRRPAIERMKMAIPFSPNTTPSSSMPMSAGMEARDLTAIWERSTTRGRAFEYDVCDG